MDLYSQIELNIEDMRWKRSILFVISKIGPLYKINYLNHDHHTTCTEYSFLLHELLLNRDSVTLEKRPGSVSGQPFNIAKCNNCVITVLDHCDQVQIDDVTNSKIFIGASSESIFIRDCKDCTLTIACKQLRTRDCSNCTIYLYCKTEPIIESSSGMKFAPFNGAYPGHDKAMKDANLNANHNLWHAVYDFNDEFKTGQNWSYVKAEDEDKLWCPLEKAENCCPRIKASKESTTPVANNKRGRVGKEFINMNQEDIESPSKVNSKKDKGEKEGKDQTLEESNPWKSLIGLLSQIPTKIQTLTTTALDYTTTAIDSVISWVRSFRN